MKLFVFLLITWGLAMSFPLENDREIEQQNQRPSVKLEKKIIEESGSKRTRGWLWRNQPPPFFAGDKRPQNLPTINPGTEIVQKDPPPGSPPYFVTLYDQARNIPFYSAYKVTATNAANIGTNSRQSVLQNDRTALNWRGLPGVDNAYRAINRGPFNINRGHMNPLAINTFDEKYMKATFTLTNAAPQFGTSNNVDWQIFEGKIRSYAQHICGATHRGTLYILTGTSEYGLRPDPATGTMVQDRPPRYQIRLPTGIPTPGTPLVIPHALWTAGCCVWQEPGAVFGYWWPKAEAASFAVMTNNQDNSANLHQTQMSVAELEDLLTAPNSPTVNLFPGNAACRSTNVNI